MDTELIVFQRFDNPVEANIVKGKLIDSGIECFLTDEYTVGLNPLYANAMGGIKLIIKQEDFENAYKLLGESIREYKETNKCRYCNSTNIHFVSSRQNIVNWITLILSLLTFTYPLYLAKVYHCDNCNREFELKE